MNNNNWDKDSLLDEIAKSLGGKVVSWDNINETIERNISFAKIMDTSKYMTVEENFKIEERNYVGN